MNKDSIWNGFVAGPKWEFNPAGTAEHISEAVSILGQPLVDRLMAEWRAEQSSPAPKGDCSLVVNEVDVRNRTVTFVSRPTDRKEEARHARQRLEDQLVEEAKLDS